MFRGPEEKRSTHNVDAPPCDKRTGWLERWRARLPNDPPKVPKGLRVLFRIGLVITACGFAGRVVASCAGEKRAECKADRLEMWDQYSRACSDRCARYGYDESESSKTIECSNRHPRPTGPLACLCYGGGMRPFVVD